MRQIVRHFLSLQPGTHVLSVSPRTLISTHSHNNYLLSTYYVPGTVVCAADNKVNQTDRSLCPSGSYVLVGEADYQ